MARSATLLLSLLSILITPISSTFTPAPDSNLTACMRTINALPDPYDLGLPKGGDYIGPTHGMTILGDACMVFCGASLESSSPALEPAVRPTSSATGPDVTKEITAVKTTSTSSTHSPSTLLSTTYMTKDVRPSETLWIVGGAHPTTLTTAPAGVKRSAAPLPSPLARNEAGKEEMKTQMEKEKRQIAIPSIPAESAAVRLKAGMCLTLCPNAVLQASVTSASATTVTVTAVPSGKLEEGRKERKVEMTPAFIGLAIVLPVLSILAVLGMGFALLRLWRRCKVLSNERNRNIEMPEGFYRMQK